MAYMCMLHYIHVVQISKKSLYWHTIWRFSTADFCGEGLYLLHALVEQQYDIPAVRALAYISPLFYHCSNYLLASQKYLGLLQSLLAADQAKKMAFFAEFPGPVVKVFTSMVQVSGLWLSIVEATE